MRIHSASRILLVAVALSVGVSPVFAAGQGRRGVPPAAAAQPAGITPAEVQQMFDAVELYQAQQRLNIRDDQFPQFLRRFKTLQEIRRQGLTERLRRINQLNRLMTAPAFDESAATEQITALKEADARGAADIAKAYDSIDEVLDTKQRVQFRVFEENMERQKLDLVTRARQASRPKP
jgi:Spy/CpxP family protein refolding chaperone